MVNAKAISTLSDKNEPKLVYFTYQRVKLRTSKLRCTLYSLKIVFI